MTDTETLIKYRIRQADETIAAAEGLYRINCSARSIVNRTYYAIFYAINALLLKENIALKTSKHIGVISIFDKEIIHSGKIDKKYSDIVHRQFEMRQKGDYRALVEISMDEAKEAIREANEFVKAVRSMIA
jgi:uncharacterized protein (UPF0332 family)